MADIAQALLQGLNIGTNAWLEQQRLQHQMAEAAAEEELKRTLAAMNLAQQREKLEWQRLGQERELEYRRELASQQAESQRLREELGKQRLALEQSESDTAIIRNLHEMGVPLGLIRPIFDIYKKSMRGESVPDSSWLEIGKLLQKSGDIPRRVALNPEQVKSIFSHLVGVVNTVAPNIVIGKALEGAWKERVDKGLPINIPMSDEEVIQAAQSYVLPMTSMRLEDIESRAELTKARKEYYDTLNRLRESESSTRDLLAKARANLYNVQAQNYASLIDERAKRLKLDEAIRWAQINIQRLRAKDTDSTERSGTDRNLREGQRFFTNLYKARATELKGLRDYYRLLESERAGLTDFIQRMEKNTVRGRPIQDPGHPFWYEYNQSISKLKAIDAQMRTIQEDMNSAKEEMSGIEKVMSKLNPYISSVATPKQVPVQPPAKPQVSKSTSMSGITSYQKEKQKVMTRGKVQPEEYRVVATGMYKGKRYIIREKVGR